MEKALKQRLVGATILIALAVIFIPMLLDSPDTSDERRVAIDLPEPPEQEVEVRRLPLEPSRPSSRRGAEREAPSPETPARIPEPTPREQPAPRLPVPESEPDDEGADDDPAFIAPPAEEVPAPPVEEAPAMSTPVAPATASDGGWLVQVASLGRADAANELGGRLESLGFATVTDTLVRGETRLHRVRVGPFAAREDAERAQRQIASTISGVEPQVVRPSGSSAAPAPPGGGRYAVQVGSFASRENAQRQEERLNSLGFPTYVNEETSGGRTIWKVRVGPVLEREEAVALQSRLVTEARVEGMVVDHP